MTDYRHRGHTTTPIVDSFTRNEPALDNWFSSLEHSRDQLQGWLKGVNSTGGTETHDMGNDGKAVLCLCCCAMARYCAHARPTMFAAFLLCF